MEIHARRLAPDLRRPLLRLTLWLPVLFALLMFVMQALGGAQAPPIGLTGLHLTECALPCWLGIIPGITEMTDAVERVRSATLGTLFRAGDGRSVSTAYEVAGALVRVDIVADEAGTVVQITMVTAPMRGIRLGDAVGYLGTPSCSSGRRSMALYAGETADAVVVGSAALGKPGLWTALSYIDIYVHAYDLHPCTNP